MTVEAMSGLSMQAGGAVAAAAGRAAMWAVSAYVQQPLRNTAVAALIGLSAMAGANILYHQAHHHPAPLFGSFSAAPASAVRTKKAPAPVTPAPRPHQLDTVDTTGSIDPRAVLPKLLGNDDVMAVQRQLASLNLFDGTVDGMYGPRTAKAIRAFETKLGRPVKGQLTPDMVALITGTQALPGPALVQAAPAAPAPLLVAKTAPMVVAKVTPAPIVEDSPLPAPTPLVKTDAQVTADTQAANDNEDTQVAEIAPVDAAPAAATLPMTNPNPVPKRQVQTIAVRVQPADQPMPSAIAPDVDVPPATEGKDVSTDKSIVANVQRGLNSLGFLHGEISGLADEATSKAIRNFEVYYNYDVTGKVSKGLVELLQQAGAVI